MRSSPCTQPKTAVCSRCTSRRNSIGKLVRSAVEALRPAGTFFPSSFFEVFERNADATSGAALARGLRENVQQVGAVLTASGSGAVERTLAESAGDESRPSSLGELVREGSLVQLAEVTSRIAASTIQSDRVATCSSSPGLRPASSPRPARTTSGRCSADSRSFFSRLSRPSTALGVCGPSSLAGQGSPSELPSLPLSARSSRRASSRRSTNSGTS